MLVLVDWPVYPRLIATLAHIGSKRNYSMLLHGAGKNSSDVILRLCEIEAKSRPQRGASRPLAAFPVSR